MRTQRNVRRTVLTAAPVVVLAVLAGGATLTLLPKDTAERAGQGSEPVAGGNAAGIKVTVDGSTVKATTKACTKGGRASLIGGGDASFAGGKQMKLKNDTATWTGVKPGSYTVAVVCSGGDAAGSQRVTISGSSSNSSNNSSSSSSSNSSGNSSDTSSNATPRTTPRTTPTRRPSVPPPATSPAVRPGTVPQGQVAAGLGGGAPDRVDTSAQIAGGAAFAVTAGVGGALLIRRRHRRAERRGA